MGNAKEVKHKIIVLVGRSAAGKDTVVKKLCERNPQLCKAMSTTSRPKRSHEVDGVDYHFISKQEFLDKIQTRQMWEYAKYNAYHGDVLDWWYYGLEKSCNDLRRKDYIVASDMERLRQLKEKLGNQVVAIYIDTPNEDRKNRAMLRDSNFNLLEWERRVSDENLVFQTIEKEVDYIVSNKVLENCLKQVENIYKWHI